jgi:hypothetical protein
LIRSEEKHLLAISKLAPYVWVHPETVKMRDSGAGNEAPQERRFHWQRTSTRRFTPAGFSWHESQALTVPKLPGPSADCLISI